MIANLRLIYFLAMSCDTGPGNVFSLSSDVFSTPECQHESDYLT